MDKARRISQDGLRILVEQVKGCAGLKGEEHIKPHSIRHNAATRLLRNGANIRDVQQFLGHTDIKTTAMYLHTSEEQLRGVAELTAMQPATTADTRRERQTQEQARSRLSGFGFLSEARSLPSMRGSLHIFG